MHIKRAGFHQVTLTTTIGFLTLFLPLWKHPPPPADTMLGLWPGALITHATPNKALVSRAGGEGSLQAVGRRGCQATFILDPAELHASSLCFSKDLHRCGVGQVLSRDLDLLQSLKSPFLLWVIQRLLFL